MCLKIKVFSKLILLIILTDEHLDKAASFDIFDYTSQNAIVFYVDIYCQRDAVKKSVL